MNKIACAIMVSLSGICLLKGETVPQKTEWKGGRLIYDGVIIKISSICLKKESTSEVLMYKGHLKKFTAQIRLDLFSVIRHKNP